MIAQTGLETLNILLDEMRPLLLEAGATRKQLKINRKKHRIDALNRAFDWLHNIKMSEEYKVMVATWSLRPALTWHNYKIFGIEDLPEQLLLQIAQKALLKKWRKKRPRLFGER